tara:strand:- start:44 stop:1189 length:1146 start_codon:yes stop_codon:yes gene_type:complete
LSLPGRDQRVNEMTKIELKQNIVKIEQILQSENYEAGFELLKTLDEPELNEVLSDLIQSTVKEKYFVHEMVCSASYDLDNLPSMVEADFNKGFQILFTLLPNIKKLDLSEVFWAEGEPDLYLDHHCIKLINKLKEFKKLTQLSLFTCRNLQVTDGLAKVLSPDILIDLPVYTDLEIWSKKQELSNYINELFKNGCFGNNIFKEEDKYLFDDIGSRSISLGYDTDCGNVWSTHEDLYLKYNTGSPTDYTGEEKYNKSQRILLNFTSMYSAPVAYLKKLIQNIIDVDENAEVWFRASDDFCGNLYYRNSNYFISDTVLIWGGYGSKEGFKWNNCEVPDMPVEDDYDSWESLDEAIGCYIEDVYNTIRSAPVWAYDELTGVPSN